MYLKLVNESTLNHNLTKYTFMFSNRKHIFYVSYIAMGVKYYKIFFGESLFREKRCSQTEQIFLTCGLYWPVDHCDAVGNLHLLARNSQSKYHPLCTFPIFIQNNNLNCHMIITSRVIFNCIRNITLIDFIPIFTHVFLHWMGSKLSTKYF